MNVLLIGAGGREHALAWKIGRSPLLTRLFAAPGNPGIAEGATCVALDPMDPPAVVAFARGRRIDLVVVGPEAPLVAGLADALRAAGIATFGPSAAAARVEASKAFTKELCARENIPTAPFARFDALAPALAHVAAAWARAPGVPIVVKADGLAAGKGVVVAATLEEARGALAQRLQRPGDEVVIEGFLSGEEASLFCLVDGETVLPFGTARDHKRALDGDHGPNTGGMGALSPAPALTPALEEEALARIVRPTARALARAGTPYSGVLYAGLMLTPEGPQLIEYNARFGDPEAQALVLRLDSDLLPILHACATGRLAEVGAPGGVEARWSADAAVSVVMAAPGYPGTPEAGSRIGGLEAAGAVAGAAIFHAGTRREGDALVAAGGRVLSACARGATAGEARARAYEAAALVDWPEGFFRRDIGL